jgi:hypothetical protein
VAAACRFRKMRGFITFLVCVSVVNMFQGAQECVGRWPRIVPLVVGLT